MQTYTWNDSSFFRSSIPPARPVLLIEDGHASHISIDVIELARKNEVPPGFNAYLRVIRANFRLPTWATRTCPVFRHQTSVVDPGAVELYRTLFDHAKTLRCAWSQISLF